MLFVYRSEVWERETILLVSVTRMWSGAVTVTWSGWSETRRTVSRYDWSLPWTNLWSNSTTTTSLHLNHFSPPVCPRPHPAPPPAHHQDCQCQHQHSRPHHQRSLSQDLTRITTATTRNPGQESSTSSLVTDACPETISSVIIFTSDRHWDTGVNYSVKLQLVISDCYLNLWYFKCHKQNSFDYSENSTVSWNYYLTIKIQKHCITKLQSRLILIQMVKIIDW